MHNIFLCMLIPTTYVTMFNYGKQILEDSWIFGLFYALAIAASLYHYIKMIMAIFMMIYWRITRIPTIVANSKGLLLAPEEEAPIPWDDIDKIEFRRVNKKTFANLVVHLKEFSDTAREKRIDGEKDPVSILSAQWINGDNRLVEKKLRKYLADYTSQSNEIAQSVATAW